MIGLVTYILYAFTNKDFTKKYQTEYTCINREDNNISVSLETGEDEYKDFILIVRGYHDDGNYDEEIYAAGDNIGEALDSIEKVKKLLISSNYKCY